MGSWVKGCECLVEFVRHTSAVPVYMLWGEVKRKRKGVKTEEGGDKFFI